MALDIRTWVDPVPIAKQAGRQQGQREMRDRIRDTFATFATRHPDPVISDELWTFVNYIERMEVT